MDLKRLQSLAAPINMNLVEVIAMSEYERKTCGDYKYILEMPDGESIRALTLTPIRERLEAEYRKLAEQAQKAFVVHMKLKYPKAGEAVLNGEINSSHYLRSIADELAVKEPTMVERFKLNHCPLLRILEIVDNKNKVTIRLEGEYHDMMQTAEQILALYERKEPR